MFISIDAEGKVIVNSIKKVVLFLNVSKFILDGENKLSGMPFQTVACKFMYYTFMIYNILAYLCIKR